MQCLELPELLVVLRENPFLRSLEWDILGLAQVIEKVFTADAELSFQTVGAIV